MIRAPAHTATRAPVRRRSRRRGPSRAVARRRRYTALGLAILIGGLAAIVLSNLGTLDRAVREITLPLRHEDIIRQQAHEKNLDPAFVAAVIYQETKFRPRTSSAGAKGLMQLLPNTAQFIARKSGGTSFELADLANPQINIAYGAWYLRYLMDKYHENTVLTAAAYNAGERNVDDWVQRAGGTDRFDAARDIPFPETRSYVSGVLDHQKSYRHTYAKELGLSG
ncbi:MAG: lytic transglycosylase domain-containing protein [Thermoleophilaceae bacterium]